MCISPHTTLPTATAVATKIIAAAAAASTHSHAHLLFHLLTCLLARSSNTHTCTWRHKMQNTIHKKPPTSNRTECTLASLFSLNTIHNSFALASCTLSHTHAHSQIFRFCVRVCYMWSKYQFEFYNVPLEIGDMLFQVQSMCARNGPNRMKQRKI